MVIHQFIILCLSKVSSPSVHFTLYRTQPALSSVLLYLRGTSSLARIPFKFTVSKLKVYDKTNCTKVFMINISSHMSGEMILGVFEIFCRGISKKFNLKVHKLQDTFLGTWTRATCVLKMSRGSP